MERVSQEAVYVVKNTETRNGVQRQSRGRDDYCLNFGYVHKENSPSAGCYVKHQKKETRKGP